MTKLCERWCRLCSPSAVVISTISSASCVCIVMVGRSPEAERDRAMTAGLSVVGAARWRVAGLRLWLRLSLLSAPTSSPTLGLPAL